MKSAFYILLLICISMCGFAEIATWTTCGITGMMVLLASGIFYFAQKYRLIRRHTKFIRNFVSIVTVIALVAEEIHIGRGDADSWLLRCVIDLIFWLFVWRAFDHDTRPKRMQIVLLSMLPLAAMAYTLDAGLYLLCLLAYSTAFLASLSIESFSAPTSGTTVFKTKRVGRTLMETARDFDLPGFGRRFATVLCIIFALSFVAFFFMPRLSQNAASVATASKSGNGQFPDIDLSKTGDIDLEPTLIFTADIPEKSGEAYWRIDVQTRFDGSKWSSGMASEDNPHYEESRISWHTLQFTQNWRDWHLPTLANTVALYPKDEAHQNTKLKLYRNADGLWFRWGWRRVSLEGFMFARDDDDFGEQIPVVATTEKRRVRWPDLRPLFDWMYGRLPQVRPDRVHSRSRVLSSTVDAGMVWPYSKRDPYYAPITELAQSITRDARTNLAKADAVVDYLQTNYHYSLKRPERIMPIVADFLFNQRSGHCELFSSSMAVLLNKVNVPARNVSGFMSSEYHDGQNYVRASHAHSWVEVYDDTTQMWIRFDPTPPSSFNQEVSAWVRFNDWFLTYRSRDLYRWIPLHYLELLSTIFVLLCGGGTIAAGVYGMRLKSICFVGSLIITSSACVAAFVFGGVMWGMIALLIIFLSMVFSIWRISRLDEKHLWHQAMASFREEAKRRGSEYASFTMEDMWNRSRKSTPDAVDTFFDTALCALYNDVVRQKLTWWSRFLNHIHIQRLLLSALKEMRRL